MTKFSLRITVLVLLPLFCTGFIFSNSLKNVEQSRKDSSVIVEIVEDVANKVIKQDAKKLNWDHIVRKSAHFIEFFVLGVLTVLLFLQTGMKRWMTVICALSYAVLVASADEFIQSFSDRSACVTDVMIDMSGALSGICLILMLNYLIECYRRKTK